MKKNRMRLRDDICLRMDMDGLVGKSRKWKYKRQENNLEAPPASQIESLGDQIAILGIRVIH